MGFKSILGYTRLLHVCNILKDSIGGSRSIRTLGPLGVLEKNFESRNLRMKRSHRDRLGRRAETEENDKWNKQGNLCSGLGDVKSTMSFFFVVLLKNIDKMRRSRFASHHSLLNFNNDRQQTSL